MKVIQESTLTNIADAIREKEQSTEPIPLSEFATRIQQLKSKGNPEALNSISIAVADGNLDALSWNDISNISNALESGDIAYRDAEPLLGLYKTFEYNKTTKYAYVIGIMQDYLGDMPRGLTFWAVGTPELSNPSPSTPKYLGVEKLGINSNQNNTGGWGADTCHFREDYMKPGGFIYKRFPSDLTAVVKEKTTYYYGGSYGEHSTPATPEKYPVSSVTDTFFVLSAKELFDANEGYYNYNSDKYKYSYWAKFEGTGPKHSEQYQLFAMLGININNYGLLKTYYQHGVSHLRTICYRSNTSRHCIDYSTGELSVIRNNAEAQIEFAFCV